MLVEAKQGQSSITTTILSLPTLMPKEIPTGLPESLNFKKLKMMLGATHLLHWAHKTTIYISHTTTILTIIRPVQNLTDDGPSRAETAFWLFRKLALTAPSRNIRWGKFLKAKVNIAWNPPKASKQPTTPLPCIPAEKDGIKWGDLICRNKRSQGINDLLNPPCFPIQLGELRYFRA